MHRFILHNDGLREACERTLSPGQVGLLSGWGVFTTVRVAGGVPFAFERHWERLRRDAAGLRVPFPADRETLYGGLLRLIEVNQARESALRLAVVRNGGGAWEGPGNTRDYDVIAMTSPLNGATRGARLTIREQSRHAGSPFRGIKTLSWAVNLAILEEAQSRGCDEAVLLNERGEVSECVSANIFVVSDGRVWTPPIDSGCLPGVTRELLLEVVRVEGIPVGERTLCPEDLASADEIFISSTLRNVVPVLAIDGRPVAGRGEVCRALEASFIRYVEMYVAEHRPRDAGS